MTWLGPAGQYHALLKNTWASGALAVNYATTGFITASAQKDISGARVVVRLSNSNPSPAVVELSITGFAAQANAKLTTLSGIALSQTNTPSDPFAISPIETIINLPSNGGNVTLPPYSAVAIELLAV